MILELVSKGPVYRFSSCIDFAKCREELLALWRNFVNSDANNNMFRLMF